jgi:hypothetical protein
MHAEARKRAKANNHLMRATGLMLVHGLGLGINENRAASEAEDLDPLEDERISGRLGVMGYGCAP